MPGFVLKFSVFVLVIGLLLPGHLLAQGMEKRESLVWAKAEESGLSEQYENYLESYPNGTCSDLAETRVKEAKSWERVKNTYTLEFMFFMNKDSTEGSATKSLTT